MMLHYTAQTMAVLIVLQICLTAWVIVGRAKTEIVFGDGGNETLLMRIRGHANFTENVPMVLLAMAGAELSGASSGVLLTGGVVFVLSRLLHASAFVFPSFVFGRIVGTTLTLLIMAGFGIYAAMLVA